MQTQSWTKPVTDSSSKAHVVLYELPGWVLFGATVARVFEVELEPIVRIKSHTCLPVFCSYENDAVPACQTV